MTKKKLKTEKVFRKNYSHQIGEFENEFLYITIEYNSDGLLTSQTIFSPDNKKIDQLINKYDDSGYLTESLHTHVADNLTERTTFEYDLDNQITYETKHFEDGFTIKSYKKLIQNEKTDTTEYYDEENILLYSEVYEYLDKEKELPISITSLDADQNINHQTKLEYDANNVLEKEITHQYGEPTQINKCYYKNSKLSREEDYINDELVVSTDHDYSSSNLHEDRKTINYHENWEHTVHLDYSDDGILLNQTQMHSAYAQLCFAERFEYEFY